MVEGFLTWYGELGTFQIRITSSKSYLVTILWNCPLVIWATEVHPVPYRTRKLSLSAPMVLGGRPPRRVGHCQGAFLYQLHARYLFIRAWIVYNLEISFGVDEIQNPQLKIEEWWSAFFDRRIISFVSFLFLKPSADSVCRPSFLLCPRGNFPCERWWI